MFGENMAPKKIRILLPLFINEIIESDTIKFNINKNKLSNMIFERFKDKYKPFIELADDNNITFQFNLNNSNSELYKVKRDSGELFGGKIDTDATLFRSFFYTYINYPADKREIIIYNDIYNQIIEAIEEKKQISVKFNGKFRTIEPFFISSTKEERFNYICCYCHKNEKIVNYRLSKIERVVLLKNNQENRNEEEIEQYKSNFDPYLSYNKKVKIRLTKRGEELYKIFTFTPKVLEILGGDIPTPPNTGSAPLPRGDDTMSSLGSKIYVVEASSLKSRLFFPQFMDEVEILEPLELREWFIDRVEKMGRIYK